MLNKAERGDMLQTMLPGRVVYMCMVHVSVSMQMCVHMCLCMWRPEVDIGCLPQSLYTSLLETGSFY